jgi:hypothetical protein
MSRASRLAEIAKANEPVFSGSHWWLADPSAKAAEPPAPASPAEVVEPEENAAVPLFAASHASNGKKAVVAISEQKIAQAGVEADSVPMVEEPERIISEHTTEDLPSRLSGLREKFLWLGRRNRQVESH